MSGTIRLVWLAVEFTPYHELFFETVAADGRFDLKVVVMMGPTRSHPFDIDRARPYAWEMADPRLRVDRGLVRRILAEGADWYVVSSYYRPTLLAAMRALVRANRPFCYFTDTPLPQDTVWNGRLPEKRSWLRRLGRHWRLRWIFSHARWVLATGDFGVDAVIRLGCPVDKGVVFPYWVDLPPLPARREPDQTIRMLGVGQLIHRKGWDLALEALHGARRSRPDLDLTLWLIGDGPDRPLLEERVRVLGLEAQVRLLGWRQPPEIAALLGEVDALVHPSRWDPYGVVILEAMSAGLPVLGSDASGAVVDRVTEGVSGWIHPVGDLVKLTGDMIALGEDATRRLQMGLQARRMAMEWPASRGVETLHRLMTVSSRVVPSTPPASGLRLIVVSAVIDPELGGPAMVLQRHLTALEQIGVEVTLFGVARPERLPVMRRLYPRSRLFPLAFPERWFRGSGLMAALREAIADCDVIHAHMLWDHPVWAAWTLARQLGKPLIVTPHGSLMEPWRYRGLHKRLYRRLVVDPLLAESAFLHVLSRHEAHACQQAGVATALRVVPNGLDAAAFEPGVPGVGERLARQGRERWPRLAQGRVLLYLGRLWEGKGVMDLLAAWAALRSDARSADWVLVLAGPDYQGFRQQVEDFIGQAGLQERVLLTGGVFGEAKASLLALAEGFVLPSRSEGASMAVLEAMASATPVVLTRECHFPELAEAGGGIEVPMGEEGVRLGIGQLLGMTPEARADMGQRGRWLASSRYTMEQVAEELLVMYRQAARK